MMHRWDQAICDEVIQIQYEREFAHLAIDVLMALGYGGRNGQVERIAEWIHDYNCLALVNLILPGVQSYPLKLLFTRLLASKDAFKDAVAAAVKKRQEEKDSKCVDMLQALLGSSETSTQQVIAENMALIIAGTDIVAQTLTWTVHYLMLYPNAYDQATHEVRSTFARDHLITSAEARAQLPFTEACLYEALRICAATGVFLPRVVPKEGIWMQGHFLPGGTQLCVNVAGANHHRETWQNPRRFVPQRFIDNPQLKAQVLSFSSGARMCPGRSLALCEMLPVLANLLKNYSFATPKDAQFGSWSTDADGNPIAMPRRHLFTVVGPQNPDRDCQIIVQHAK
ncbi:hypothetical protein H4R20_003663 [Coemansia guatemalensis]|uniref:Cytochrome P450 n=1 Tax=Coemansia guatemalensis TaxID=2761395 RepID=A0A9W8HSW3_9FUNG|nr:hypothetical protein H4R20_003663 [Coemansia guatemalensis]